MGMVYDIIKLNEFSDTDVFNDGNDVIFKYKDIAELCLQFYRTFSMPFIENTLQFKACLDNVCSLSGDAIKRMYQTLKAEYNPLENYNKTSTITDSGNADNTHSNVPSDSIIEKETSKDVINNSNTRTETTRGNIGVTTSQQMLESEMELRMRYNINLYVTQIVKTWYMIA